MTASTVAVAVVLCVIITAPLAAAIVSPYPYCGSNLQLGGPTCVNERVQVPSYGEAGHGEPITREFATNVPIFFEFSMVGQAPSGGPVRARCVVCVRPSVA